MKKLVEVLGLVTAMASMFTLYLAYKKDTKRKQKRRNAALKNGEPAAKKLKRTESSSSSSDDDDDDSLDSNSSFDIFSSESGSDSEESSYIDESNSEDDEDDVLESDNSPPSQDDISIKEEPLCDSDIDNHSEDEKNSRDKSRVVDSTSTSKDGITIKTEVLDSIVDAVEVDRRSLLNTSDVQVKEEPTETANIADTTIEVKDEPDVHDAVGSSSDALTSLQN